MHNKLKASLGEHELAYPDHKQLNDMSTEDLISLGEIRPSKPFSMNVGYALDKHHHNRPLLKKNYDHFINEEEKDELDQEIVELGELTSMLHDPEYIDDILDHTPSHNQQVAREILHHYLEKHGPEEGYMHLEKDLMEPLFQNLKDRIIEESIIDHVLSPKMTQETPHSPENYKKLAKAMFIAPIYDGHSKDNWRKNLNKIFERRMGDA